MVQTWTLTNFKHLHISGTLIYKQSSAINKERCQDTTQNMNKKHFHVKSTYDPQSTRCLWDTHESRVFLRHIAGQFPSTTENSKSTLCSRTYTTHAGFSSRYYGSSPPCTTLLHSTTTISLALLHRGISPPALFRLRIASPHKADGSIWPTSSACWPLHSWFTTQFSYGTSFHLQSLIIYHIINLRNRLSLRFIFHQIINEMNRLSSKFIIHH